MDDEPKIEGEFVAPQSKSTTKGPWGLFGRTPPFASYIDRVFRRERVRRDAEHTAYMCKLLDTKAMNDSVVSERVEEVLREIRGVPRWRTYYQKKRSDFMHWYWILKHRRWPAFRRTVGF